MYGVHAGLKFWSGSRNEMRYFLCVIGMVMIIEGLPYFVSPEKMKIWMQRIIKTPAPSLRRLGFGLMAAGLVLVYLGRY
jgi:uncharacterized protein YjeT (DUF2065 family)